MLLHLLHVVEGDAVGADASQGFLGVELVERLVGLQGHGGADVLEESLVEHSELHGAMQVVEHLLAVVHVVYQLYEPSPGAAPLAGLAGLGEEPVVVGYHLLLGLLAQLLVFFLCHSLFLFVCGSTDFFSLSSEFILNLFGTFLLSRFLRILYGDRSSRPLANAP